MGWGDSVRYKNMLIPGCKVQIDESTDTVKITCNAKKILGDMTIVSPRPVQIAIQGKKMFTLDDGELPEPTIEEIKSYIKRNFKAQ